MQKQQRDACTRHWPACSSQQTPDINDTATPKEAEIRQKPKSIPSYAIAHPTKAWKRSTDEALSVSASRRLFAPRAGCPTATSAIRAIATIRMPAQRISLNVKCARFRETLARALRSRRVWKCLSPARTSFAQLGSLDAPGLWTSASRDKDERVELFHRSSLPGCCRWACRLT